MPQEIFELFVCEQKMLFFMLKNAQLTGVHTSSAHRTHGTFNT